MVNVNLEKCIGCGLCVKDCFPHVIEVENGKAEVKNNKCFKCGHCVAVCPKNAIALDDYDMNEVKEYVKEDFDIKPEVLLNFIKFRRSVRQFKKADVDNNLLKEIIEAGRFTQTATNSQDVSYVVLKNNLQEVKGLIFSALKEEGEKILSNLNEQTMKYKRYAEMWINMYKEYNENPEKNDKIFFNAPTAIVVVSNTEINGGLASSNMELMADALGLGTFFSGFFVLASQRNPKIKELLGLKEDQNIVTCMIIGHPAVKFKRTVPRKSAEISWK